MNCPYCHHEIRSDAVQVNIETVVDHYDIWLARKNGRNPARVTERIAVITIQEIGIALQSNLSQKPSKATP